MPNNFKKIYIFRVRFRFDFFKRASFTLESIFILIPELIRFGKLNENFKPPLENERNRLVIFMTKFKKCKIN